MSLLARIVALLLLLAAGLGLTFASVTELELVAFGLAAFVLSTLLPE